MLGPVLFLIYINDLLEGLVSSGKIFADDSKIFKNIRSPIDRDILQSDLAKLEQWSKKWLLQFNASKTHVMHIGRPVPNPQYSYTLNNQQIEAVKEQNDLGIIVSSNFSVSPHVARVAAKANSAVGRVKHTFSYMNKIMFQRIYPGLICSHMEFAV